MSIPFPYGSAPTNYQWGYLFFLMLFLIPESGHTQDALKLPVVQIQSELDNIEENGSGILVGRVGKEIYILTAAHVIANPNNLRIQFFQGSPVRAQVLQTNSALDIAALKCTVPTDFEVPSSFALAKEPKKAQQSVIVIGHPLGNYWDINYNSNVKSTEHELDERLFTLAPIGIAPGNSGGPVLNLRYELMGLVREVDPVKAVCVDAGTLLKACQAWEVPTNLLTGVTVENTGSTGGDQDFRYQVFIQEANTAFAAGKWAQAKRAFEQANLIAPNAGLETKIQTCEIEIARDEAYLRYLQQGKSAGSLEVAIPFYQLAQQQHNTEEVRHLIQQGKEKLALLEIRTSESITDNKIPEQYTDSIAGKMVLVRGGTFSMGRDNGEDDEWPAHQVYLDDYYIGVGQVTHKQYCRFLTGMGYQSLDDVDDPFRLNSISASRQGRKTYFTPIDGKEETPVKMSHHQAFRFCMWLSRESGHTYKIPTEAEWEYAITRGTQGENGKDNDRKLIEPSKTLGDLCSDWYDKDYYAACKDLGVIANPSGPLRGRERTVRGGGSIKRIGSSDEYERQQENGNHFGLRLVRIPTDITNASRITEIVEKNMAFVDGGTFEAGGNLVTVDAYYISKVEVTEEFWRLFMPSARIQCEGCAISNISWNMVQQFITGLNNYTGMNYRLPTEAEWEYAAMGGKEKASFIYAGSNILSDVACTDRWDNNCNLIASYKPNELGIFDMSGSVNEWCMDWYSDSYYGNFSQPTQNPQGPPTGEMRVIRGGEIKSRFYENPEKQIVDVGFRLLRPALR